MSGLSSRALTSTFHCDALAPVNSTFAFKQSPNTAVFLCAHVARGAPVLYVSHDADGDWQFLCGGDHGEATNESPVLSCLRDIVTRDPSLNELASVCSNHFAERVTATSAWKVTDESETFIQRAVEEHGWAVQLISAGDENEPAFAYTIGLFKNWNHPELIVLGLRLELMHSMVNEIGARVKAGARFTAGDSLQDVSGGYDVRLRAVQDERSYRAHVGYARWFYSGAPFPLLQVVWPDRGGHFPGEPGAVDSLRDQQPLLP